MTSTCTRFCFLGLFLTALIATGCDYRWSDADREQARQMLLKEIALPGPGNSPSPEIPTEDVVESSASKGTEPANIPADRTGDQGASKRIPWIDETSLPSLQWDIVYLGNRPVGYTRRSVEVAKNEDLRDLADSAVDATSPILRIEAESRVRILRKSGEPIDQTVVLSTLERIDGELLGISGSMDTGVGKRQFRGSIQENTFKMESTEGKIVSTSVVPWETSYRGPFAIEQSLRREPMKPKEVRMVAYLDPFQMAFTESRLEAITETETVDFEGLYQKRLEIENRSVTQGKASNALLWSDAGGVIRKTYTPGVDRQTFDCDPITARYVISREEFDASVFKDLPLLGSYPKVSDSGTAFFRIASQQLSQDGSVSGRTNQRVVRVNEKAWDVEVTQTGAGIDPDQDPVDDSMLASTGLIDWKDPIVQRWIQSQKGTESDPQSSGDVQRAEHARRLAGSARKWVAEGIERVGLDRNLQSPAATLRERKGDCMDHAIALVAVLRSLQIPSRIAIGFKAEPSTVRPTFQFYCWVEYHDSLRWIPIDSFIDSDSVPADRLKISESSMPSINAYEPFLSAIRLLPDVEISARGRKP
jgi:hypothetical protein